MGEEPTLYKRFAKEEGQVRLQEAASMGHMDYVNSSQ